MPELARIFAETGFKLAATGHTYEVIREAGIEVYRVNKLSEGRPNVYDLITNGKFQTVITCFGLP